MKPHICLLLSMAATAIGAPEPVRTLFDFENAADIEDFARDVQGVTFETSQDEGVTRGKRCARVTFEKGGGYCEIRFTGPFLKGWESFDYFAMDVTAVGDDRAELTLEFWDSLTKDYYTRCSLVSTVVPGRQTVIVPIARCKRNGKEGRDWEELEPQDKMRMGELRVAKLFVASPKDHDLVWRIDNVRLLREEALGTKMSVDLPAGTTAFVFGKNAALDGFATVPASAPFDGVRGFTRKGDLVHCGGKWPDPLTGAGVYSPTGAPFTFETALADGAYLVWVAAGPVLRNDIAARRFLLKVGDRTLQDESPSLAELNGEKHLYRFMRTPYSQRPNALWLDFIRRMYPAQAVPVTVSGGRLAVEAAGYMLSSVVVAPAAQKPAFDRMVAAIEQERIRVFASQDPPYTPRPPARLPGDGAALCFIPDGHRAIGPNTGPTGQERTRTAYDLAAAPGQNVIFRVAVAAFEDAGTCTVRLSPLKGPSEIPGSAVRVYLQDFRQRGADVTESALVPTDSAPLEKGVTRCFWAWARIPDQAVAGDYAGTVAVAPGSAPAALFPLRLKVYPFRLAQDLPYSFGMWYRIQAPPDPAQTRRVATEQLAFMRQLGMTGVEVGGPDMNGSQDPMLIELAKAAGMGRAPGQYSIASTLGMGRQIGRVRVGLGARVDRQPGCELDDPRFKDLFVASAAKYATFLKGCGLPVAVQTVDEPREHPNPWNRNLEQTNLYGDYLRQAGVSPTYTTPMADGSGGKDYASLMDHHDIIATHPGRSSERLMAGTLRKGRTLWLYNAGMDRLSWGFYNWRAGSKGRWEWHFCWIEGGGRGGYLNEEWYNPFTSLHAFAPHAPYAEHPGAMLFQSAFLTCAEGITDAAYLVTLERAIANASAGGKKSGAVADAEAFLATLRREIPFLPDVKGITGEAHGAAVGEGLETPAAEQCEAWRRRIGDILAAW